jgi:ABC-type sugar transport system substrate-binding protein
MDADGGHLRNLSNSEENDWEPAWSPDGSQIAFVSDRPTEDGGLFIYVMNADGSGVRRLSAFPDSSHPDWSPDGSAVVFSARENDNRDIYVMRADGSAPAVNLTNSPEQDTRPTWSPDGSLIAWLSGDEGAWNIFVMNVDGSNAQQITNGGRLDGVDWTIDGQLFTVWDSPEHGCCNFVIQPDGSNVQPAGGKGELQRYMPFWTLDGSRVELVSGALDGGNEEIYQVGEIFEGYFNNLTNNPANDRNPDWPARCGPEPQPAAAPLVLPEAPPPAAKFTIGYAGDDESQPQRKQAFQDACDELGIECLYGEAPELIEQGAMAIIQNTGAQSLDDLQASLQPAVDKGIPVFVLDAELGGENVFSVSINHNQWVEMTLQWLYDMMDGTHMAVFDLQPLYAQGNAVENKLAGNPGITVVERQTGEYDPQQLRAQVLQLLADHPELNAIWTNAGQAEVIRTLRESGLPVDQWPTAVCEASKAGLTLWADVLADTPDFDCIALINPPGIAYDAVYAAYFLLEGHPIKSKWLGGAYGNLLEIEITGVLTEDIQGWLEPLEGKEAETLLDVRMDPKDILERWFER